MMATKPILFNGPMVRVILGGKKTQTRRVIKPQPAECQPQFYRVSHVAEYCTGAPGLGFAYYSRRGGCWNSTEPFFPQYSPGDVLWVRETTCLECGGDPCYRADNDWCGLADQPKPATGSWRPSIHMPKWACRLFLRVTNVRAERLQDISNSDAVREGVAELPCPGISACGGPCEDCREERELFRELWDSLCTDTTRWAENPWVWAYTFERCEQPEGWA